MSPQRMIVATMAVLIALCGMNRAAHAEKTAAELLPPSTLVYVEVNHASDLVDLLADHPLRKDLEHSSQYRQVLESTQFKQFKQVVEAIEKRAGVEWRPALKGIGSGGVYVAVEPLTQGIVLLVHPSDIQSSDAIRDAMFDLVRGDAANKGKPDPIETKHYRGLTSYHAGDAIIADLGPWLMICNKKGLAQRVADLYLDGGDTLSTDETFTQARQLSADRNEGKSPCAWAFVRLAPLRLIAKAQPFLSPAYKADNIGFEFLLGGLLPIAQNAPYATASLQLDRDSIKLSLAAPSDPAWVPANLKFFYAGAGDGAEQPLLTPGLVASVTAYRDASAMWQAAPDLFTEAVATQMAQADSGLSNLLGGKNFGIDVLGAFKPQMQLVVARQDFSAGARKPAIRLPAGALVVGIRPEQFKAVRKHFRVGYQSIIALGNLDGASKGRPLLDSQSEKRGDSEIEYAIYSTDDDAAKPDPKKKASPADDIYLNFSPALAISPRHMMLCSTRQLAEQLADLDAKQAANPVIAQNMLIQIDPKPVAELIQENREQLIAQNMLEKGHDRTQAEKEIDAIHAIVNYFSDAKISLTPAARSIRFDVELKAQPH